MHFQYLRRTRHINQSSFSYYSVEWSRGELIYGSLNVILARWVFGASIWLWSGYSRQLSTIIEWRGLRPASRNVWICMCQWHSVCEKWRRAQSSPRRRRLFLSALTLLAADADAAATSSFLRHPRPAAHCTPWNYLFGATSWHWPCKLSHCLCAIRIVFYNMRVAACSHLSVYRFIVRYSLILIK